MQNRPLAAIVRHCAAFTFSGASLLGLAIAPANAQKPPALFFETIELDALSVEQCWSAAARAMQTEFGNQKFGVEAAALFGAAGPATISIACKTVGGQTIATVLAAADLSFEETAAIRDRLLQALEAQL